MRSARRGGKPSGKCGNEDEGCKHAQAIAQHIATEDGVGAFTDLLEQMLVQRALT